MKLSDIDPRLRATALLSSIRHVDKPVVRAVTRAALRSWPSPRVPGVRVGIARVGSASLRVYEPEGRCSRPALLWIHGGGLVVGSARQDDGLCARTAARLDAVVVSVDYRLAPEDPCPAAIDDVFAGWQWLLAHAEQLDVDTGRLAIGGESAGGGLAACLVQRIHDAGGVQPIAQWLFAPMLDDRTAADAGRDAVDHFVWNNRANRFGWTAYLQQPPGGETVPAYAVAARRTDLTGLPPTWIYTTEIELFHDEVLAYASLLREAGATVELRTVPAAPHAFELFENTAPARALMEEARAWLDQQLRASSS
ncbi:alpha/beta hydrolase [Okibacterium endophyticum]